MMADDACHVAEHARGRGQPGEGRVLLPAGAQGLVSAMGSSLRYCFAVRAHSTLLARDTKPLFGSHHLLSIYCSIAICCLGDNAT